MKKFVTAASSALLATLAFAQPVPPEPPATPDVTTVTENCGEGCTRTVTKIVTSDTGSSGAEVIRKDVEVIELHTGASEDIDIDVDVETSSTETGTVRKQVKIIAATDGEITPEMREKINSMISDIEEDGDRHKKGDGLVVLDGSGEAKKARIIIREDGEENIMVNGDVKVDHVENADGSRTIRVTPNDGSETTVITIKKEKSSKNDN